MIPWEEFRARIQALKRERWVAILAAEPPGRPAGRRPRDPAKEAILTEIDRRRVERSELLARSRRVPVPPAGDGLREGRTSAAGDGPRG